MKTDFRIRVRGFDGKDRVVKQGSLATVLQEDFELFFEIVSP